MSEQIRWGILSTARIGIKKVIPAIKNSRNGIVTAIASRDVERARAVAKELEIKNAYGSYEELLADNRVDAIYIPLPNSMHAEWAIKCAQAGKPTLCEKPLAISAAEAQQMVNAFQSRNLLFAEAFMYRFHPQNQRVWQMVQDGAIGDVQIMSASFSFRIGNRGDIRLSRELAGGALMDVGCYCINAMRFMTGEEPVKAQALARFGAETGIDEEIVGTLEFPSGARGHLDASLNTFRVSQYEVRGTNGRIVVPESFTPDLTPGGMLTLHHWSGDKYEAIQIPTVDHYQLMVEDFADALLKKRPPRFAPQDAVANMRAIEMLLDSARKNAM